MNKSKYESYDIVQVKRPSDDVAFTALVLGVCDTGDIYTLGWYNDNEQHPLGKGWMVSYASNNSILGLTENSR